MNRNLLIVFCALFMSGASLYAQDANAIMTSAKNRVTSETIYSRSRMVITARNGTTTNRVIEQISKDGPNGARTVIIFIEPASVAGTRFLTMDNASGGTDQWIYLPSSRTLRRIAASDSGGNFMGTDFSYDDISSMDRDVSLDTHTILREETLNNRLCYVIQSVPRTSNQYSKTITWIDKENYLIYKAEMYNSRNEVVKIMEMSDFRSVQGRITPMQTRISTVTAGTSTTIFMEGIRYDTPIDEGYFTTRFLETGRP